jgi:hypothetical protein
MNAQFAKERFARWGILETNTSDHAVLDKIPNDLDRCVSHSAVKLIESKDFPSCISFPHLMLNLVEFSGRPQHLTSLLAIRSPQRTLPLPKQCRETFFIESSNGYESIVHIWRIENTR